MATLERTYSRATRRAERALTTLGSDVHDARLISGKSQRQVGREARMSGSNVSRIEAGKIVGLSIIDAARIAAAVGLELSVRTFPAARPSRDAGHARRLARLLGAVAPPLHYRIEVMIRNDDYREQRAWDAGIFGAGEMTAIEFEVRLYDVQAQVRRLRAKQRDGGQVRLLLVVADTRANRRVLPELAMLLPELPRLRTSEVLKALRSGEHPESGLVLL